jgi:hypothetical protein
VDVLAKRLADCDEDAFGACALQLIRKLASIHSGGGSYGASPFILLASGAFERLMRSADLPLPVDCQTMQHIELDLVSTSGVETVKDATIGADCLRSVPDWEPIDGILYVLHALATAGPTSVPMSLFTSKILGLTQCVLPGVGVFVVTGGDALGELGNVLSDHVGKKEPTTDGRRWYASCRRLVLLWQTYALAVSNRNVNLTTLCCTLPLPLMSLSYMCHSNRRPEAPLDAEAVANYLVHDADRSVGRDTPGTLLLGTLSMRTWSDVDLQCATETLYLMCSALRLHLGHGKRRELANWTRDKCGTFFSNVYRKLNEWKKDSLEHAELVLEVVKMPRLTDAWLDDVIERLGVLIEAPKPKPPRFDNVTVCYGPSCVARGDLKACMKCREARYCSVECQRTHWPVHRKTCKK